MNTTTPTANQAVTEMLRAEIDRHLNQLTELTRRLANHQKLQDELTVALSKTVTELRVTREQKDSAERKADYAFEMLADKRANHPIDYYRPRFPSGMYEPNVRVVLEKDYAMRFGLFLHVQGFCSRQDFDERTLYECRRDVPYLADVMGADFAHAYTRALRKTATEQITQALSQWK